MAAVSRVADGRPLNLLLVVKNTATLRTLAPVLRALNAHGHRVRIATKEVKTSETHAFARRLVDECEGLSFVKLPYTAVGGWSDLAEDVRNALDYLRYLGPRYRDAEKLRARARREVPPRLARLADIARLGVAPLLRIVERSFEPSPRAFGFLREQAPDVVMIAPLVGFGSPQADLLRAARRLGIRSCLPVPSWDNLTNKGLLREPPDLVLVWNDLQAAEAVELHRVPASHVRVTGAPTYDHWFERKPSRSREDFCREVGLDPARPYVLYAGSTAFIAPDEPAFFRRWLAAVRERLPAAGVLVRPHPLGALDWRELDEPGAVVWPRNPAFPLGEQTRADYFDSIHHSAAVVGINTSALIESAIAGRPVHTVLADEFRQTQQGTLHFHYLVDSEFGHVRAARTLDEHAAQLERSVADGDAEGLNERFLRRFVRPQGPATPLAVEAIEELAARPAPAPVAEPRYAAWLRRRLAPLARREARRREAAKAARESTPLQTVKRHVRELARGRDGTVVAGPWTGDELDELLVWIPFLRWAATANLELADRLVVLARPRSAAWYAGLTVVPEATGDPLEPALIEPHLGELAAQDPWAPLHGRMLEFAPLPEATAPYTGSDPVEAVLAVLGGVPAVYTGPPDRRLRLAVALGRQPYGRLQAAPSAALEPAGV
jgi:hypothetical protein